MAKGFVSNITKDILWTLFETGKIAFTGKSSFFAIEDWKIRPPKDAVDEEKKRQQKKFYQALWRLRKSRLVIIQEKETGEFLVELSEKGRRKIIEMQFADLKIERLKRWDGIWRIVIYDIPDRKKSAREALRNKLVELGFYQLQKSVWVFPYPCKQEVEFIIELFDLYPFIHIIQATDIQNDVKLQKHFHLL